MTASILVRLRGTDRHRAGSVGLPQHVVDGERCNLGDPQQRIRADHYERCIPEAGEDVAFVGRDSGGGRPRGFRGGEAYVPWTLLAAGGSGGDTVRAKWASTIAPWQTEINGGS